MVTNTFKCTDNWALLGDISAIHSLILSNHSAFDMEFYIDPTADLPSDDLSGHRLQNSENFYGYFPDAGFIFVRNWFKALNKNAFGAVSLETFSWVAPPLITGFLSSGSTSFDFETDLGSNFTVEQDGITNTYVGNGATSVTISGLNDASEITIKLSSANTYFKFKNDNWLSFNLRNIGSITNLDNAFFGTRLGSSCSITSFECDADLSQVTSFKDTFANFHLITSFPLIDVSSCFLFDQTWAKCGVVSFPPINFSHATTFNITWAQCPNLVCFEELDFTNLTGGLNAFDRSDVLVQPPETGTPVRGGISGHDALAGVWSNPGTCP